MLLGAVRALSARQQRQTRGGESGGAVPGVAAAGRDAAPGEFTAAPHHIALQISDICCVWMYSQYVAVRSGKSKVKGPGCALRAFIVQ